MRTPIARIESISGCRLDAHGVAADEGDDGLLWFRPMSAPGALRALFALPANARCAAGCVARDAAPRFWAFRAGYLVACGMGLVESMFSAASLLRQMCDGLSGEEHKRVTPPEALADGYDQPGLPGPRRADRRYRPPAPDPDSRCGNRCGGLGRTSGLRTRGRRRRAVRVERPGPRRCTQPARRQ